MILSLNCRNVSCHGIFPFAVSLASCFAAIIFLKQTPGMVRRSDRLIEIMIEIMDFVSRHSVSFLSQLKLHLRSLDRAAGCGAERAPPLSRRYRATLKRPTPPPQPKRQSLSPVRGSLNSAVRGAFLGSYGLDGSILKGQSI